MRTFRIAAVTIALGAFLLSSCSKTYPPVTVNGGKVMCVYELFLPLAVGIHPPTGGPPVDTRIDRLCFACPSVCPILPASAIPIPAGATDVSVKNPAITGASGPVGGAGPAPTSPLTGDPVLKVHQAAAVPGCSACSGAGMHVRLPLRAKKFRGIPVHFEGNVI